jgi:nucleotide-binding universal stress UspA family protein
MSTQESRRVTRDARRAVGLSTAPVSAQETAMHRYLSANTYEPTHRPTAADQAPSNTAAAEPHGQQIVENPSRTSSLVVVGIDGSGCARHAGEWAAAEAVHRQADLKLVYAYHLAPAGGSGYNPYPPHLLADLRDDGTTVLADMTAALHRRYPDLAVTSSLTYGDPVTVLRHASGSATLTVVGTHGRNRMTVALGSVAASVAATSPSPVAVIHPGEIVRNGPVVVGVDGSQNGRTALSYAFQAAADRHATLIAVHCWTNPSIDGPVPEYAAGIVNPTAIRAAEQHRLAGELADLICKYPGLRVKQTVVHDRPAEGLLRFAPTAQLIVAGSHGHRGITGLMIGSTSQALIAGSSCPVVIARPAPTS